LKKKAKEWIGEADILYNQEGSLSTSREEKAVKRDAVQTGQVNTRISFDIEGQRKKKRARKDRKAGGGSTKIKGLGGKSGGVRNKHKNSAIQHKFYGKKK